MGFEIPVVDACPVTEGSEGVMTMTAEQVAMVAGAVRDKIEWMVLLHGERSADGYEVRVDRFTVPEQYRSGAEVELAKDIMLPDDCVGVMHSHHRMGAFFSNTDLNELNPRFPSSIVVAIDWNNLGFKYKASGKVVLPCGAVGVVDFSLAVEGDQKFVAEPIKGQHSAEYLAKDGLKGCTQRAYGEIAEDAYMVKDQTQCGLTAGKVVERPLVFGMNGEDLLAAVRAQTRTPVDRRLPAHYTGNGGNGSGYRGGQQRTMGFTRVADDDDDRPKGGKGKRRKGKGGKLSARRNGLVKLERPEADRKQLENTAADFQGSYRAEPDPGLERPPSSPSRTTVQGNCDRCGWLDRITWIAEPEEWLCGHCQRIYAEDKEDGAVVIVGLDDDDTYDIYGGGWGV